MYGAADDLDAGGIVAELLQGIDTPPGSVPQLRLLAALHELVLTGAAPELGRFYPTAGGGDQPDGAWSAAHDALIENFAWIKVRLERTVQTNEPGRSAVLFGVLLWLTVRYRLAIRLLEVGASAGLNLLADRYCYVVGGAQLGDPSSAIRFQEPWRPPPPISLPDAMRRLRIAARAGCDRAPLDPSDREHRLRLLSYIWPDEPERIRRIELALELATREPAPVVRSAAVQWLPGALQRRRAGELTVIWHSLFRQYVSSEEWTELELSVAAARAADPGRPIVWVGMEPSVSHLAGIEVTLGEDSATAPQRLARCGDHGPPVSWEAFSGPARV